MNIPEIPNLPATTFEQAVIDLLASIANEEEALSQLLKAEAKRNLTFTGKDLDFPTKPSNEQIIQFCQSTSRVMETIFIKEWLLYEKLNKVLELMERNEDSKIDGEDNHGGSRLKTHESAIFHYHESLGQAQQVTSEYFESVGRLMEGVTRKDRLTVQTQSKKWLTLTVHRIVDLQRLLLQKNGLIEPPDNRSSIKSQRNMTLFHLKSTHSPMPWIATKNEPPLKPWLSQKVYRHY